MRFCDVIQVKITSELDFTLCLFRETLREAAGHDSGANVCTDWLHKMKLWAGWMSMFSNIITNVITLTIQPSFTSCLISTQETAKSVMVVSLDTFYISISSI